MRCEPWYQNLWWSFRWGVCQTIAATWDTYAWWHRHRRGWGYGVYPWTHTIVWWLVGLPCYALEQASGYWFTSEARWLRPLGQMVLGVSSFVQHRLGLSDWVDSGGIHYDWCPADGAEHGILFADRAQEVGFWMRSDLVDKNPLKRTRVAVSMSGGAVLDAGGGT